jgi:predicted nucleic acid-binding protein
MVTPLLIDSNVILDILTEDKNWFSWSSETLMKYADESPLAINPIIYAEVSIRFERIEDLEAALEPRFFSKLDLPWEAAFLAGKCFLKYRQRTGSRRSPLPDFYIGAHAAVLKTPLITRAKARYESYFPKLKIIAP